ncbi:hypothetical protein G3N55_03385 [Dissulfurirhabdus thermomarina]|uniref:Uncharacterized protein n=1 Tax=Dissulfurirhabdus thermomarina TaxID=1765737 RepID=A0A6N9TKU4_DISTH|nr:hypothetical protein [Dissulfurirhabdus thermomarina]NDY41891.1 hypothetical protein [Dissulfurirhabdus thermomarina]NMX23707.1 hypothetical protein [Dissulfurirhabdus thermomarina]
MEERDLEIGLEMIGADEIGGGCSTVADRMLEAAEAQPAEADRAAGPGEPRASRDEAAGR